MGHMLRLLNLRIETDEERIPLLISEVIVKETHSIIVFCPLAKTLKKRSFLQHKLVNELILLRFDFGESFIFNSVPVKK